MMTNQLQKSGDHKKITASLLATSSENPKPTLDIAKEVFGPAATCKMANSYLYHLQKMNFVNKICEENGKNPRWYWIGNSNQSNNIKSSPDSISLHPRDIESNFSRLNISEEQGSSLHKKKKKKKRNPHSSELIGNSTENSHERFIISSGHQGPGHQGPIKSKFNITEIPVLKTHGLPVRDDVDYQLFSDSKSYNQNGAASSITNNDSNLPTPIEPPIEPLIDLS